MSQAEYIVEKEPSVLLTLISKWLRFGLFGLVCLFAVILYISLLTHDAGDPAWTGVAQHQIPKNWMGSFGAFYSDITFTLLGRIAYLIPITLILFAYQLIVNRRIFHLTTQSMVMGILGTLLLLLSLSAFTDLVHNSGIEGGVIGRWLGSILVTLLSLGNSSFMMVFALYLSCAIFAILALVGIMMITRSTPLRWADYLGALALNRIAIWRNKEPLYSYHLTSPTIEKKMESKETIHHQEPQLSLNHEEPIFAPTLEEEIADEFQEPIYFKAPEVEETPFTPKPEAPLSLTPEEITVEEELPIKAAPTLDELLADVLDEEEKTPAQLKIAPTPILEEKTEEPETLPIDEAIFASQSALKEEQKAPIAPTSSDALFTQPTSPEKKRREERKEEKAPQERQQYRSLRQSPYYEEVSHWAQYMEIPNLNAPKEPAQPAKRSNQGFNLITEPATSTPLRFGAASELPPAQAALEEELKLAAKPKEMSVEDFIKRSLPKLDLTQSSKTAQESKRESSSKKRIPFAEMRKSEAPIEPTLEPIAPTPETPPFTISDADSFQEDVALPEPEESFNFVTNSTERDLNLDASDDLSDELPTLNFSPHFEVEIPEEEPHFEEDEEALPFTANNEPLEIITPDFSEGITALPDSLPTLTPEPEEIEEIHEIKPIDESPAFEEHIALDPHTFEFNAIDEPLISFEEEVLESPFIEAIEPPFEIQEEEHSNLMDEQKIEPEPFSIEIDDEPSFESALEIEERIEEEIEEEEELDEESYRERYPHAGKLPPLSLLKDPPIRESHYDASELSRLATLVENAFQSYGIDLSVVDVEFGPIITRLSLELSPGIKIAQINNLSKDIARALAVTNVRVQDVIPGTSYVGLEVPNAVREIVHFKEGLISESFQSAKHPLTIALGQDISGQEVIANLEKMPHLLVAGTTGSGKSVGINTMLLSLLFKARPEELRMILIDPKMLELSVYNDIPHLLAPVVTDMNESANALRWCVAEMERRYLLLSQLKTRNIGRFNQMVREANERGEPLKNPLYNKRGVELSEFAQEEYLKELPYIVVVIDEFADMMMIVGKKCEELIARLAQKARASGIHLILATQRPSVDVVTGLIKANVPSRIAFQVSGRIDSRTILDQQGAETLLGNGDMLYLPTGASDPRRVHGAFISDEEVNKVVEFIKLTGAPDYIDEILNEPTEPIPGLSEEASGVAADEVDELYDEAVRIVLSDNRPSASHIQRRLRVGYNRAARIIDQMEQDGYVSAAGSNGTREILIARHSDDE